MLALVCNSGDASLVQNNKFLSDNNLCNIFYCNINSYFALFLLNIIHIPSTGFRQGSWTEFSQRASPEDVVKGDKALKGGA